MFGEINREYYLLNIIRKEEKGNQVDKWISHKKTAPIFYGKSRIQDIITENGKSGLSPLQLNDAKLFCQYGLDMNDDSILMSIGENHIYFFQKCKEISETGKYSESLLKSFPIKIIKIVEIKSVPLILSSIKSNRWLSSGTFRKIVNFGNILAINYILSGNKKQKVNNFIEYLKCLSSIELETLVAKILEEIGFFVPAYKGGYLRAIDLIISNRSDSKIKFRNTVTSQGKNRSIQVKLKLNKADIDSVIDFYFCVESDIKGKNILDASQIQRLLKKLAFTKDWLKQTLNWIDYEF